ncbi:MAG: hypothetical protein AB8H86_19320 [Polyangiales bacterium]
MRLRLAALLVLACACGDDTAPMMMDAGMDSAVTRDAELPSVANAAEATRPVLECPAGWFSYASQRGGSSRLCDSTDHGTRDSCEGPTARFVGSDECQRVGTLCSDPLPSADGPRFFVRPDAAGGDGSEESPFGTIAEAAAVAESGDTLVLEPGEHIMADETLELNGISLLGRCASDTFIRGAENVPTFSFHGRANVRNLTFRDTYVAGFVETDATTSFELVAFLGVAGGALVVLGEASLREVLARGGVEDIDDLHTAFTVRGTLRAEFVAVEGFDSEQFDVEGSDALLELTDAVLKPITTGQRVSGGHGIEVERGARALLRRVDIQEPFDFGVVVSDEGSFAEMESCAVGFAIGDRAVGVLVNDGARASIRSSTLYGSDINVVAVNEGTSVDLTDVILSFAEGVDESRGYGVFVADDARALLRRVESSGSLVHEFRAERGGVFDFEDVYASGTYNPDDEGPLTSAVRVQSGAELTFRRLQIEGSSDSGLEVGSASVRGTDLLIADTLFEETSGVGAGMVVRNGGDVDVERVEIQQASYIGAMIIGDADVSFRELRIDNSRPSACFDRRCLSFLGGIGLGAYDGARVDVDGFRIERAALIGVQVGALEGPIASVDLRRGSITRSQVGLNVQDENYDTDRLLNEVTLERNERNFDGTTLPVPQPSF